MSNSYLVVGLGNIGAEYADTRHNMGFMVLDAWAKASNTVFESGRYGSTAEVSFRGRKFTLVKPSTYMNLSGKAVRYWMNELKMPLENLLVISDDLNLPFGTLRLRKGGSAGGHNGLTNITEMLGTQDYARIRVGIGNDFSRGGQIDFVLGELSADEKAMMPGICERVIEGIKAFATVGPDRAMNVVNTRPKPSSGPAPQDV
ncbi:MAG: aminoacyl-tRNA hydrolase [Bacteroidetes bacterium]|uniref:Peptidyl-tRNA hydrolase n=1 Tax=Candidatus Cryptobacteroides excrementipullorum TaxID=2840761 RepID=A0A9D9IUB8_9BACT|nr:aminoacyl-tRNA hydrolase [Candidatus Cryptobacteroides excrementipullorum]